MNEEQEPLASSLTLGPTTPSSISFGDGKKVVVTLYDGGARVKIAEGVTIDEAAKVFWDAVTKYAAGAR